MILKTIKNLYCLFLVLSFVIFTYGGVYLLTERKFQKEAIKLGLAAPDDVLGWKWKSRKEIASEVIIEEILIQRQQIQSQEIKPKDKGDEKTKVYY